MNVPHPSDEDADPMRYCKKDLDLRGHDPEADLDHQPPSFRDYGAVRPTWQYASELAFRAGCEPDNGCWHSCRESAADHRRQHLKHSRQIG